jgi:hypothetical protein
MWEIEVNDPLPGKYRLQVIGIARTIYYLEIVKYDEELNDSRANFLKIPIKKGDVHTYMVESSDKPGAKIKAWREKKRSR